jgi:hypothetical protein
MSRRGAVVDAGDRIAPALQLVQAFMALAKERGSHDVSHRIGIGLPGRCGARPRFERFDQDQPPAATRARFWLGGRPRLCGRRHIERLTRVRDVLAIGGKKSLEEAGDNLLSVLRLPPDQ